MLKQLRSNSGLVHLIEMFIVLAVVSILIIVVLTSLHDGKKRSRVNSLTPPSECVLNMLKLAKGTPLENAICPVISLPYQIAPHAEGHEHSCQSAKGHIPTDPHVIKTSGELIRIHQSWPPHDDSIRPGAVDIGQGWNIMKSNGALILSASNGVLDYLIAAFKGIFAIFTGLVGLAGAILVFMGIFSTFQQLLMPSKGNRDKGSNESKRTSKQQLVENLSDILIAGVFTVSIIAALSISYFTAYSAIMTLSTSTVAIPFGKSEVHTYDRFHIWEMGEKTVFNELITGVPVITGEERMSYVVYFEGQEGMQWRKLFDFDSQHLSLVATVNNAIFSE